MDPWGILLEATLPMTFDGVETCNMALYPAAVAGRGQDYVRRIVPHGPGGAYKLVTAARVPLRPLNMSDDSYGWAASTCLDIYPLWIRSAAMEFLIRAARFSFPRSLLPAVLGPETVLVIRTVSPLQATVAVDGDTFIVDIVLSHSRGQEQGYIQRYFLPVSDVYEIGSPSEMVPAAEETVEQMVRFQVVREGGPSVGSNSSCASSSAAGEECSICWEKMAAGDETGTMPCKHAFHAACIRRWLDRSGLCPLCRYRLPTDLNDDT